MSGENRRPMTPADTQQTLQLAFNLAPVGMCVSRDRVVEICNEAFARMFGYDVGELVGKPLAPLYPSLDEFAHVGNLGLPVMRDTGVYSDERIMRRKNGELFWCHVAGPRPGPLQPLRLRRVDVRGHLPAPPGDHHAHPARTRDRPAAGDGRHQQADRPQAGHQPAHRGSPPRPAHEEVRGHDPRRAVARLVGGA